MQIVLAHKIELRPNRQQEEMFRKAVGVARFAYNWALEQWQKQYQAHQQDPNQPKPNEATLRREFNRVKREQYPWVLEVPKSVPQQAIKNLGKAFQHFLRGKGGYPRFHKKGRNDSARMDNGPGKTCSACGSLNAELKLSDRVWTCSACGTAHDRDVNAAVNLLRVGLASLVSPTASYAGSDACGDQQGLVVEAGTVEWNRVS